ncbi:hypothetical protein ACFLZJ_02010, partial [Nanoarchaeota archaeon]
MNKPRARTFTARKKKFLVRLNDWLIYAQRGRNSCAYGHMKLFDVSNANLNKKNVKNIERNDICLAKNKAAWELGDQQIIRFKLTEKEDGVKKLHDGVVRLYTPELRKDK